MPTRLRPFVAIATPCCFNSSRGPRDVKVNTSTLCVQLGSVGLVNCPSTNSVQTNILWRREILLHKGTLATENRGIHRLGALA